MAELGMVVLGMVELVAVFGVVELVYVVFGMVVLEWVVIESVLLGRRMAGFPL